MVFVRRRSVFSLLSLVLFLSAETLAQTNHDVAPNNLEQWVKDAADGDTLSFQSGIYNLTKALWINKTLTLQPKPGSVNITIVQPPSDNLFYLLKANLTIIDLQLQGNGTTGSYCLNVYNSALNMTGVNITKCYSGVLYSTESSITRASNCTIFDNAGVTSIIGALAGAWFDDGGIVDIANCSFSATTSYPALSFHNSKATISHSQSWDNAGTVNCQTSDLNVSYSTFSSDSTSSIYSQSCAVALDDCTFSDHTSSSGSALWIYGGTVNSTNCFFINNRANSNAGFGGAIWNSGGGDLTSTDDTFNGNSAYQGGAIMCSPSANAVITRANFTDNSASQGGGIFLQTAIVGLHDCFFTSNNASQQGGALYNLQGKLDSTNGKFNYNLGAGQGGAMYHQGSSSNSSFTGDSFKFNTAPYGGALRFASGTATLQNITTFSNAADLVSGYGGALDCDTGVELIVKGSNFTNDSSSNGGCWFISACSVIATDCNFHSCNATAQGGAIYLQSPSSATITESSIVGCSANYGGGIYLTGAAEFSNCSITDNQATLDGGGVLFHNGQGTFNWSVFEANCAGRNGSMYWIDSGSSPASFNDCINQTYSCQKSSTSTSTLTSSTSSTSTTTTLSSSISSTSTSSATSSTTSPSTSSTSTSTLISTFTIPISTFTLTLTLPAILPTTTSSLPTTTTSTTPTSLLPTSTSSSVLATSSSPQSTTIPANCSVSCSTVVVDQSETNTTWEVVENSTNVQLNVTTASNSSLSFQVGWGSIREVTSQGILVKSVDPLEEDWPRTIELNETTVVITYSTTEVRPPWQDNPLKIALTSVLTLQANATSTEAVASAKFSLSIDGEWLFAEESNRLEADFTVKGSFQSFTSCGKKEQYRVSKEAGESIFHLGATESSAVTLGVQDSCLADTISRATSALSPIFQENNTVATVTIRFPSFKSSLYYDPNFGLLLGFNAGSACDPLLTYILPAAFLAGAAVIIVASIAISYIPAMQLLILGSEGARVRNLRDFVSQQQLSLDSDLNLVDAGEPRNNIKV